MESLLLDTAAGAVGTAPAALALVETGTLVATTFVETTGALVAAGSASAGTARRVIRAIHLFFIITSPLDSFEQRLSMPPVSGTAD